MKMELQLPVYLGQKIPWCHRSDLRGSCSFSHRTNPSYTQQQSEHGGWLSGQSDHPLQFEPPKAFRKYVIFFKQF